MNQQINSHSYTLDNGLQVQVVPYSGIKTVIIRAWVFVGAANENPQNNGISHFLEHMIFRGNEKLGTSLEMNRRMEELGGDINAATSFDQTEYWLEFHQDFLEEGIRRFCQFLRHPIYEQMETERSIIIEEILGDYNDEDQLIDTDSLTALGLWRDQSMGLPIAGTTATVKEIKKSDLRAWYQEYYKPGNMILGITGDIDPYRILPIIKEEFNQTGNSHKKKYAQPKTTVIAGEQLKFVCDRDNQFNLHWTFPLEPVDPRTRTKLQLISRILDDGSSSVLQSQIREEKGLVYDISGGMSYFNNGCIMSIQSLVSISKFSELISVLTDLLKKLIQDGFTEQDFNLAKLRYKAYLDCLRDTPQGILAERLGPVLYPAVVPVDQAIEMINSITLEELNQSLIQLLQQKSTYFVLVGPVTEEVKKQVEEHLQPWILPA